MLIKVILLIIGIFVMGSFFGMICYSNMDNASSVKRWICAILVTIISGGIIVGAFTFDAYIESSTWNDGIHENCGGYWHFTNASKGRHSTYYYYQCNKCQTIVDFSRSME